MNYLKIAILPFCLLCIISCKSDSKSYDSDSNTLEEEFNKNSNKSNLSSACEKDLKELSKFMDDFINLYEEKGKDGSLTPAEQREYDKKAENLSKELTSSAGSIADPKCAMELLKIQNRFNEIMLEIAADKMN